MLWINLILFLVED